MLFRSRSNEGVTEKELRTAKNQRKGKAKWGEEESIRQREGNVKESINVS